MKKIFEIEAGTLRQALKRLKPGIDARPILPILSSVLFRTEKERVILRSVSPGKVDIEVKCDANLENDGAFAVPFVQLARIAALATGPVTFSYGDGNRVKLEVGTVSAELLAYRAEDFPERDEPGEGAFFNLSRQFLWQLETAGRCASRDDSRKCLCGVLFEAKEHQTRMVGTDGKRMMIVEGDRIMYGNPVTGIIPFDVMRNMKTIFSGKFADDDEFRIAVDRLKWSCQLGSVTLRFKGIEGTYPNYRQVIPTQKGIPLVVNCADLLRGIRVCSVVLSDSCGYIDFAFSQNRAVMSAKSAEIGTISETLTIERESEEVQSALFNGDMLSAGMTLGEKITIEIIDGMSPTVIKGDKGTFVIMPIRKK